MRRVSSWLIPMMFCAATALAQTPRPAAPRGAPPPAAPAAPGRPAAPTTPVPPAPPAPTSWDNVRLELTLNDSSDPAGKKTVSMIIMDGRRGSIRSQFGAQLLNVDAIVNLPRAVPAGRGSLDGKLQLNLTMQYRPKDNPGGPNIDESLWVTLADGKPTLISQSADPGSDRKVTVEVTATVLK